MYKLFLTIVFLLSFTLQAQTIGDIPLAPMHIQEFYKNRQGLAWIDEKGITEVALYAKKVLENAAQEGLNPQHYADGIQALNEHLDDPVRTDVRFTEAFFKYIDDVYNGRFDPVKFDKKIVIKPDPVNPGELINNGLQQGGTQWIDQLPPQYPQYIKLKQALENYPEHRQQIITTMERWRWMPRHPGNRYLLVNIARFELLGIENNLTTMQSPIIVGKKYTQTPVFAGEVYGVIFNPVWHIPPSIVRSMGEKLNNGNFRKTENGYIQPAGPNNALGKIRFSIKVKGQEGNPYNIYMHSTPNKSLFEKSVRDFSHGCIRVKNLTGLANFVFNDPIKWPTSKVEKSMEGTRTNNVKLENDVPVFITYYTAWANDDGTVTFSKDIYGQDQHIIKALGIN